ncbi:peptidoglycan editing factor PgeF [Alcanivorax sp. 1008]|uniref:peptidoglycan editing factor PgeF n=1 Tax=Alcanivorax sp. 1008 TaxID=2816853 RepID=UPI001D63E44F|nr:peptidoglycan editing factor PgeF [Alcanivorax sp. 1008]MCC1497469.1 peptidoglycan editing factor PgeF [Alcanivorax sp. 1008]
MMLPGPEQWLVPDWQPHSRVRALVTSRRGNHSPPPWDGFNLGDNCGDDSARVAAARAHLHQQIGTTKPPFWLTQVHGVRSVRYGDADRRADGACCDLVGHPCAVLTADCLPVLMARRDGSAVGAYHAGWRGLLAGMLEVGVQQLAPAGEPLSAWLGPAICQSCYQVGDQVRDAFMATDPGDGRGFREDGPGHWRMDMFTLARRRLQAVGVNDIHGGNLCTSCRLDEYYSYRRDGQTGRFATLIWLND